MKQISPSSANQMPRRRSTQTSPAVNSPQQARAHANAPGSARTPAPAQTAAAPTPQTVNRPAPQLPEHPADPRAARAAALAVPAWVLLPLRLFLGVTFVYAGLQKLTDPHYFRPGTATYIGTQIAAFAHGTPLQGFLTHVALPHAVLFGALVAYGELAIGAATLVGLLMRPAAVFGLLLSLTFFLSASWRIYPYFYGADIVFVFGWITLLLAGPVAGGFWPALDARLAGRVMRALRSIRALDPARRAVAARVLSVMLGVPVDGIPSETRGGATAAEIPATAARRTVRGARSSVVVGQRSRGRGAKTLARRDLLRGAALGGGGMLALVWLRSVLFPSDTPAPVSSSRQGGAPAATAADTTTPSAAASGTAATTSNAIGQVSQIAPNSAVTFTIPSNQDPGVLVRTQGGNFVAFDATCTHAGCPVQYDPSSQLLICPCHGAAFDPTHNAAVVQGPTDTPLASVPITVNKTTGAITLNS